MSVRTARVYGDVRLYQKNGKGYCRLDLRRLRSLQKQGLDVCPLFNTHIVSAEAVAEAGRQKNTTSAKARARCARPGRALPHIRPIRPPNNSQPQHVWLVHT